jgi:hypothetical protein
VIRLRTIALAFALLACLASKSNGQHVGSFGGVYVTNSATGTTGSVAATLPAVAGKTTYLCGFTVTFSNPTAAANVTVAVTNTIGGTLNFQRQVLAAAATVPPPLDLTEAFLPCVPASAPNTTIVVTQPGLGAGATGSSVAAWGYQAP